MIYFICVLLFASFTILDAQVSGSWKRLLDSPVYGIGINPKNPETIIVGGLGRTLYKTKNGGLSWTIDSIEFRSGSSQLTNILFLRLIQILYWLVEFLIVSEEVQIKG